MYIVTDSNSSNSVLSGVFTKLQKAAVSFTSKYSPQKHNTTHTHTHTHTQTHYMFVLYFPLHVSVKHVDHHQAEYRYRSESVTEEVSRFTVDLLQQFSFCTSTPPDDSQYV